MTTSRRNFLKLSGACAFVAAPLMGCGANSGTNFAGTFTGDGGDLGQGETAILNTFYSYKQLTVSLLSAITAAGGGALTGGDFALISQIFDHETAHLTALKSALGAFAIPNLTGFDFTSVPLDDRDRILNTLRDFEDVGVLGWNGSTRYLGGLQHFSLLESIASVDARHSAVIRQLLDSDSDDFAGQDVVGAKSGVGQLSNPFYVLSVVRSYGPLPELDSGDLP